MNGKCQECGRKFKYVRIGSATRRLCEPCRDELERQRAKYRSRPERVAMQDQSEDAKSARSVAMGADLLDENGRPTSAKALLIKWLRG
jgi:hypothetical protein